MDSTFQLTQTLGWIKITASRVPFAMEVVEYPIINRNFIMKRKKDDLISRRDFFRKAKSKAIPILAIAFASLPLLKVTAKAKAPSGCYMGTCMGTCFTACVMSCTGSCLNACYTSCVSQCAMMCNGNCRGGCNDTCAQGCSSCVGECKIGCGNGCSGSCIANCASYSEHSTY